MKKVFKCILWVVGILLVVLLVLVIITNTHPYFTEPEKINPENCDYVAKDRAAKAMFVQEQHPESVIEKGSFEEYYNAFYAICVGSGI